MAVDNTDCAHGEAFGLKLSDEEISYLEEQYVPHAPIGGVVFNC